jgi:hypothetical protein
VNPVTVDFLHSLFEIVAYVALVLLGIYGETHFHFLDFLWGGR